VLNTFHLAAPVPYSMISCLSISDSKVNIFEFNNLATPECTEFLSVDIRKSAMLNAVLEGHVTAPSNKTERQGL
jgi:hypothetical protein